MKYYIIRNKEMPWGDYGNILFRGLLNVMDKNFHDLEIPEVERTGPFVPDIYIANTRDLVITDHLKKIVEKANLSGIKRYKEIKKKKIVNIDWQQWDLAHSDPKHYPKSGEPEDYILKGKHDETLIDDIPKLWNPIVIEKKILKVISNDKDNVNFSHLAIDGNVEYDIVCSLPRIVVSERFKSIMDQYKVDSIRYVEIS